MEEHGQQGHTQDIRHYIAQGNSTNTEQILIYLQFLTLLIPPQPPTHERFMLVILEVNYYRISVVIVQYASVISAGSHACWAGLLLN